MSGFNATMNPKPGVVNARVGVYFYKDRTYERLTITLETPFTYEEAKKEVAKKLGEPINNISRVTFN